MSLQEEGSDLLQASSTAVAGAPSWSGAPASGSDSLMTIASLPCSTILTLKASPVICATSGCSAANRAAAASTSCVHQGNPQHPRGLWGFSAEQIRDTVCALPGMTKTVRPHCLSLEELQSAENLLSVARILHWNYLHCSV